ncbi:amidohydrolase family protein [Clostridium chromiireducens]|uniref:Amidohydrolase family protein n=1 Tax=Clostridium chromiireducens TaxID=225345 RepID=A0A964RLE6_9CLOT|nr:amidohydrolase family protein [Clostridium chromiireducens]MVX63796.1 amidohydrolase family protein [Clostridium chromiireducens]
MIKALINVNIFNFDSLKEKSYVLFDKQIIEVGSMENFKGADEVYDCNNQILMPGLVNCHSHIYSTFARGWITEFNPKSFVDLLEQMWWKLDKVLDEKDVYYSALVSGIEFIKNGVTTVVDHHASGKKIKGSLNLLKSALCDQIGIRGVFCFESSDRFSIDECVEENIEFSEKHSTMTSGLFGMHACLTLSDESLKKIADKSKGMPIHIHVGESDEDNIENIKNFNKTPIERLEEHGLLRENSILSHCIYLSENDMDILKKYKVYVALNPTSNFNNAVGLADVLELEKREIKCILGNDGLGFNLTRDMVNLMFGMHLRYKNPTAYSLGNIKKIIENNYEYASNILGCKLGKIEEGYEADFLTLEYTAPTPITEDNLFGHFFYGMLDNFKPKNVWCNGEIKLKNYKVLHDEEKIYKESTQIAREIWEKCKEK